MRISDWSSDVCSSDLWRRLCRQPFGHGFRHAGDLCRWLVSTLTVPSRRSPCQLFFMQKMQDLSGLRGSQSALPAWLLEAHYEVNTRACFNPTLAVKIEDRKSTRLNTSH